MAIAQKHKGFRRLIGDESNPTMGIAIDETSHALHIFDATDERTDWNVSAYSDPTVLIHCADTNAATDYIKIWHDDTDANIDCYGATAINLGIGGTNYVELSTSAFYPTSAAGVDLGTSALGFNDLHLDSGGVVNFDGGDVTLTHKSNELEMAGGNLNLIDDIELQFGTGNDVTMDWNGSVLQMIAATNDTGYIAIGSGARDLDLRVFLGAVTKYALFDVGQSYFYLEDVDLKLGDNDEIKFGDASGGDVSLKWDASLLQMLPVTDDTGYFAIGNGTLSMDFRVYLSTSAKYVECDVGNDYFSLVNASLYAPNLATTGGQAGIVYVNSNGYLIQSD